MKKLKLKYRDQFANRVIEFDDPREDFIASCGAAIVLVPLPTLLHKCLARVGWFGAGVAITLSLMYCHTIEHVTWRHEGAKHYQTTTVLRAIDGTVISESTELVGNSRP